MNFQLLDVMGTNGNPVTGHLVEGPGNRALLLHFDGYGERNTVAELSAQVLIENRNGVPYVVIWGDINQEDPTHVISLEGADIKYDKYEQTQEESNNG